MKLRVIDLNKNKFNNGVDLPDKKGIFSSHSIVLLLVTSIVPLILPMIQKHFNLGSIYNGDNIQGHNKRDGDKSRDEACTKSRKTTENAPTTKEGRPPQMKMYNQMEPQVSTICNTSNYRSTTAFECPAK